MTTHPAPTRARTSRSLADLFSTDDFDAAVEAGYVRVQHHPTLDLHIANYSEKAQYENAWSPVTLTCRGLIFTEAGEIVARPYRKFFNHGDDANTGPLDMTASAIVTDKLDGSLGITYSTPDGTAIATRGSFASDQAVHATAVLRERYAEWEPLPGCTYLFEIVYPANRIVVDYGDRDDLILHGMVEIATGRVFSAQDAAICYPEPWPGPIAETFDYATLGEALAAPLRDNAEGLVVTLDGGAMVKLKQADYVALHRIITGLNARTVWEWLGDGKTVGDLCATLPDDFHGWVEDIAAELIVGAAVLVTDARQLHEALLHGLDEGWTRGDYARAAQQYTEHRPYMFLLLDGNEDKARQLAWRAVKPSGARTMVNHSEAVA